MDDAGERTLRAKYLDWCSARVAERFLDLSAEEIWALSRPAEEVGAAERAGSAASGGSVAPGGPADRGGVTEPGGTGAGFRLPPPDESSYRALVQRATEALLEQMSLPPFEAWRREYEASPARFDAEMLGFWREASGGDG